MVNLLIYEPRAVFLLQQQGNKALVDSAAEESHV